MIDPRERDDPRRWRYEVGPSPETAPSKEDEKAEHRRDRAWLRLLIQHMPFHAASNEEYDRLTDELRDLEKLFLGSDDERLRAYYAESYGAPGTVRADAADGPVAAAELPGAVRHVVVLQAALMEEVFYALRLDRYANAPDNRGWMNLFRRWGQSPAFNARFDEVRRLLTREFLAFFDDYVRGRTGTIDAEPVPHPWDVERAVSQVPAPPEEAEAEWMTPEELDRVRAARRSHSAVTRLTSGVFLDSGIREAQPARPRGSWVAEGAHGTPEAKEASPTTPPPPAEGPSGGGDVGAVPNA